jgi:hypothetical protein
MKTTFTYTLLRYVHDIATGEFVNMSVALYAPEAKCISAICSPRYGRLSKMFLEVNGDHLSSVMRYIQGRFEEHTTKFNEELRDYIQCSRRAIDTKSGFDFGASSRPADPKQ